MWVSIRSQGHGWLAWKIDSGIGLWGLKGGRCTVPVRPKSQVRNAIIDETRSLAEPPKPEPLLACARISPGATGHGPFRHLEAIGPSSGRGPGRASLLLTLGAIGSCSMTSRVQAPTVTSLELLGVLLRSSSELNRSIQPYAWRCECFASASSAHQWSSQPLSSRAYSPPLPTRLASHARILERVHGSDGGGTLC